LGEKGSGDADRARARLYLTVARVMVENYDGGISDLGEMPVADLGADDRTLLVAARKLAAHLHDPPRVPAGDTDRMLGDASRMSRTGDTVSTTIERAETALSRTASLTVARGKR
jgi:hypothetical protein